MHAGAHQLTQTAAAAFLTLTLSAASALAGDETATFPPLAPNEIPIPPTEWRALSDGKTLYYREWGRFTGRERYYAGTDEVAFKRTEDQRCVRGVYGYVTSPRGEGLYCYDWDERVCFQHFRRDGQIYARRANGSEALIFKITPEPLTCDDDVVS